MGTANKYNQLLATLRKKIFDGEYGGEGRLPSERDLSTQLGYSRMTVRAVLQEFADLGLLEKRPGAGNYLTSWLRCSEKMEQVPIPVGPRDKVLHFGFIVNESMVCSMEEDPYYNMLMLGFINARHSGRAFEIETISISQAVRRESVFDELAAKGIAPCHWDGMIIATELAPKDFQYLDSISVPYVLQGEQENNVFRPVVTSDNYRGAFKVAAHLLGLGRKKPLLAYYENLDLKWMELRLHGIRECYRLAGIEVTDVNLLALHQQTEASVKKQIAKKLSNGADFDSVICFGDWTTITVIDVIQKKTPLKIPEDLVIVSFDTYTWMDYSVTPPLTCVSQQFVRIGEYCINELYRQIDRPEEGTMIRVVMPIITSRDSMRRK